MGLPNWLGVSPVTALFLVFSEPGPTGHTNLARQPGLLGLGLPNWLGVLPVTALFLVFSGQ
jgi:hypothetical protein